MKKDYAAWFAEIKRKVQLAQLRASASINTVLIELYWDLGKEIVTRETEFKWGDNFLLQLSIDLKSNFPQINGFSRRNLYTIRHIKDPYHFDFLGLEEDAQEREIELTLTQKITDFMLELGKGFAFVGRQYRLEIGN